jgi:hypothetical protein
VLDVKQDQLQAEENEIKIMILSCEIWCFDGGEDSICGLSAVTLFSFVVG